MRGKKGLIERETALWLMAVFTLVVLVMITLFLKSKGINLLAGIFEVLRFGR